MCFNSIADVNLTSDEGGIPPKACIVSPVVNFMVVNLALVEFSYHGVFSGNSGFQSVGTAPVA